MGRVRVGLTLAAYEESYDSWAEMWQPGGIAYLISYAQSRRPNAVEIVVERRLSDLIDAAPDMVGLSSVTYNFGLAREQARHVKAELGVPVVVGGPHITLVPLGLPPEFDCGVVGEGEETFIDLIDVLASTGRLDPADLRSVPGIVYHEAGVPTMTAARPPIEDLDSIPPRAREPLHQWGDPSTQANLFASRGCPFTCSFCSTVEVWGRRVRRHSASYIADEIAAVREAYDPSLFLYNDDLFALKPSWLESISKELNARHLLDGIEFRCDARASTLQPRTLDALQSMNVTYFDIGLESGSDDVLNKLGKDSSLEINQRAMDELRSRGLRGSSCFILGTPGETRENILDTFRFVYRNLDVLDDVLFTPLIPLPGTEVFEWAQAQLGITVEDIFLFEDDLGDWDRWMATKWPYMNNDLVPLPELINYIRIGRELQRLLPRHISDVSIDPKIGEYGWASRTKDAEWTPPNTRSVKLSVSSEASTLSEYAS